MAQPPRKRARNKACRCTRQGSATSAFSLGAAYDYAKGNDVHTPDGASVGNQHFNRVSVMADYFLSKRTDLYAEGRVRRPPVRLQWLTSAMPATRRTATRRWYASRFVTGSEPSLHRQAALGSGQ
ncbi:porin [Paraburkholderia mimosarum]|uniref:porin n=1 Tax=Paraburkholderia mimosarum TaxID=312026 RepID=UPI0038991ADB